MTFLAKVPVYGEDKSWVVVDLVVRLFCVREHLFVEYN